MKALLFIFLVYNDAGQSSVDRRYDRMTVDKTLLESVEDCLSVKAHLEDILPESLGPGLKRLSIECVAIN